jgi:hypothetical protein
MEFTSVTLRALTVEFAWHKEEPSMRVCLATACRAVIEGGSIDMRHRLGRYSSY